MPLRMTNQREIILQELQKSKKHMTADELYSRVRKVMPRISLATVYRNLETLSDAGIIAKLEMPTVLVQEGGYLSDELGDNLVGFLKGMRAGI